MRNVNEYFKPFIDEIEKYEDGIHELNEGVNIELIEKIEEKLKIKLPTIYKQFLTIYNGGEVFEGGDILTQVFDENLGEKVDGIGYLDEVLDEKRRWPNMPYDYIIIGGTNYGDIYCIDLKNSNENEAYIIEWEHETGEVVNRWNRLIDWLMHLIEIGEIGTNYDGSEKDIF